jgi:hypothetical protein
LLAVSERLLHATVGITENLYVHVTPHMQEKCVDVMDEKITPHLQKLGLCVQDACKRPLSGPSHEEKMGAGIGFEPMTFGL